MEATMRIPLSILVLALTAGCAKKPATTPAARSPEPPIQTTTAARPSPSVTPTTSNVGLDSELARTCRIVVSTVDEAPKFDFDSTALTPQDRDVLAQVAKCVTTGPLRGRALRLVGRADARGETEYNFTLGDHRAGSVRSYLRGLGVDDRRLSETSRGKLDATGHDEDGWRRDRRVDIMLQ
jgi:peptidoglycan-associated lipoprotein